MLFALLLATSSWALAQGTGEVWGRVFDSKSGTTIPGVSVFVKNGAALIGVNTDADGYFRLKPLPTGTYTVQFSCLGYGEGSVEQVVVYSDGIAKLGDYKMDPGVEITGATIYSQKVIGFDVVPRMNINEIADMPGNKDIKKIVSSMSADIQTTDDGALYFRGARDDDFVYYVDGIRVAGDNMKVPSTAIGSIQVYTGGVPARYGDFTGGCVVIETQSYFNWLNGQN